MLTQQLTKEYTRRGITFTKADPIQHIVSDLIVSYGNALDLTSIVKIALIEHWKNQTGAIVRNATKQEARIIEAAEQDETLDHQTTKIELAKLGLLV